MFSDDISCTPNPCENGSECQEAVNTILCVCPAGTFGETCDRQSKTLLCCSRSICYRWLGSDTRVHNCV